MIVACDLDGVLVDTADALREAYRTAGVEWRPNVPWREWCTPAQRALKANAYPRLVKKLGKLTPFGRYVFRPEWTVLTGASFEGLHAVEAAFPRLKIREVKVGMTLAEKIEFIALKGVQVYFDDDHDSVMLIRREVPTCQTIFVQLPL